MNQNPKKIDCSFNLNKQIKCKNIFNNSQWQGSFFQRANTKWNKLPQDVVSCERVEHFCLKLKIFNLNSKNISKIQ